MLFHNKLLADRLGRLNILLIKHALESALQALETTGARYAFRVTSCALPIQRAMPICCRTEATDAFLNAKI